MQQHPTSLSTRGRGFLAFVCYAILFSFLSHTAYSVQHRSGATRDSSWVEATLAGMTLEEKVGQVVMEGGYGHFLSTDSDEFQRFLKLVREDHLGGVIMFQGDVYETAVIVNKLQAAAKIPLLVSADFERGLAMRLRRGTYFPDAMAIGATRNPDYAYAVGRAIAVEGRALGIHQNYAPVADVNTNPENPVINTRAFSENQELVTKMAVAFAEGTNDGGMIATAKHFPGHGDTGTDSHLSLPVVPFDRVHLDSFELAPFRSIIHAGIGSIMVAHLSVPAIDPTPNLPATLSGPVVTRVLEGDLDFSGLVVTDAMGMRGVTRGYAVGESAVRAFQAGVDIILMPPDEDIALDALIAAVRSGAISQERLDRSVRKILRAKELLHLPEHRMVDLTRIADSVGTREHRVLAAKIARDAITLLRNNNGLLPISPSDERKVVSVVINDTDDNMTAVNRPENPWTVEPAGEYFNQQVRRRHGNLESYSVSPDTGPEERETILSKVRDADVVLVPIYLKVRTSSGTISIPPSLTGFLDDLSAVGKPVVVISFGSPYFLSGFPNAAALECAYGDAEVMVKAAVEALFGEITVHGKLPVTVSPEFPYGSGIDQPAVYLRPDDPAMAGFDPIKLQSVDRIVQAAIRDSAFPGAQVAIIKDGMLAYRKSFGTYTYDFTSREIDNETMYDMASLTKVIATTSAVMKLYDQWKLLLTDPVGKYIPQFSTGPKANITIQQLLTHTSGLKPFLKLYDVCKTPEQALDTIYASSLIATPGDSTIYSDLGFITLGKIVEKISGLTLDEFVKQNFFVPLGMNRTMFNPPPALRLQAAPTEFDSVWRMRLIQGTVHDERAALFGGVAGHAGLFSTASDVAVFMQMLLNGGTYGGTRYLTSATVKLFTTRQSEKSTRALGWDTKSQSTPENPVSSGTLLSPSSFGHTGFTGTSIWADPGRNLAVIFLTNRVYPTRANHKLFAVRPALVDAVVRALEVPADSQASVHQH